MGEVGGDEGKEREAGCLEGGYDGQGGGEKGTLLAGLRNNQKQKGKVIMMIDSSNCQKQKGRVKTRYTIPIINSKFDISKCPLMFCDALQD